MENPCKPPSASLDDTTPTATKSPQGQERCELLSYVRAKSKHFCFVFKQFIFILVTRLHMHLTYGYTNALAYGVQKMVLETLELEVQVVMIGVLRIFHKSSLCS